MPVKTEKPIPAITPPPQDSLESIELDLDIHCAPKEKGLGSRTGGLFNDESRSKSLSQGKHKDCRKKKIL